MQTRQHLFTRESSLSRKSHPVSVRKANADGISIKDGFGVEDEFYQKEMYSNGFTGLPLYQSSK